MQRVLIAGCGYLGAATAELFQSAGWEVEGWTASPESAKRLDNAPYAVRAVDLTNAATVTASTGMPFDVVIQCVSSRGGGAEQYRQIYLAGARNLVAAFPAAHLLFTSSTSVYAQHDGEWVDESSPAEPERETGRILRETEEFVVARSGIVARLGGIYGPGRSALLRKFLSGDALLEAGRDRYINQAHRDDIAAALLLLVQHLPATAGQIYNLTDNHPVTLREAYEWLAVHVPGPPLRATEIAPARKRGDSNKRISSARLLALGWVPRYPTFEIGMRESVLPAR